VTEDSEGRDKRSDDMFEDLDKFFAPIQDVDWPEEPTGEPDEAAGAAQPPPNEPEAQPPPPEPGAPGAGAGPSTQEASSLDEGEEEDEWGEIRSKLRGEEEPEGEVELEEEAAGPGTRADDSYGFMRDFLPDQAEEEGRLFPEDVEVTPGADVDLTGAEAESDLDLGQEDLEPEPAEISLEDLRKAPEEYRDLPAPPSAAGEEEAPGLIVTPPGEEGEVFPTEDLEVGPAAVRAEEEPPPGGVEAAAEHFAEAIRESGELPVIPREEEPEPVDVGLFDSELEDARGAGGVLPAEFEEPAARTIRVGATEGIGPSWQEPTSVEVATEAEEVAPPGGRNVPMAFLVGVILAAIGLGSVAISKAAFVVVAVVVVGLAQLELYSAIRRLHHHPAVPLGLAFGALTMVAGYLKGEQAMLGMVALSVPFTFLWYMALPPARRRGALVNIGMTLFPLLYVPFLAGFLLLILSGSTGLMLAVLGLAVGFDVAAYLFGSLLGGSWFGERGLAPTISPSKTWEGLIVAALIVILVSVAALANVDPISSGGRALGLALVISVAAPLGDLAESLLKRDMGIKDMGSILPGHGGVLDRIDSVLFAAPLAFYFFRLFY
jgi:phosphatidate cytidylyltransferase